MMRQATMTKVTAPMAILIKSETPSLRGRARVWVGIALDCLAAGASATGTGRGARDAGALGADRVSGAETPAAAGMDAATAAVSSSIGDQESDLPKRSASRTAL